MAMKRAVGRMCQRAAQGAVRGATTAPRAAPAAAAVGVPAMKAAAPMWNALPKQQQRRWCSGAAPRLNEKLRNVSVIAHVDHGKTTLVDALLQQSGAVKNIKEGARVMDSNEIEMERGITILAKNTCVQLPNHTLNIVDTPGHSDFAGEVERALQMVEGFILLVDGAEGPKPGTRYVLKKSLELNLKPIVVINKVDRTNLENIERTRDQIESLFLELATNDDQLDYPVVYGSGKAGFMSLDPEVREGTLQPLFDTILEHIPPPKESTPDCVQAMITSMEVDSKGKKEITMRVASGVMKVKDEIALTDYHQPDKVLTTFKVESLLKFQGLNKIPVESVEYGDIAVLTSSVLDKFPDCKIGMSFNHKKNVKPMFYKPLDDPTFMVTIHPNRSPLAGDDGKLFTGPDIRARLEKEAVRNLAMKLEVKGPDEFKVTGRGLLHLGVLFEEMRRQGFEIELAKPSVLFKEEDGKKMEPWDIITTRTPSGLADNVAGVMYQNNAEVVAQDEQGDGWTEAKWLMPGRCAIGMGSKLRMAGGSEMEIMQEFQEWRPYDTSIQVKRDTGSIVSAGDGQASDYGLGTLAKHGTAFITEKTRVYLDMIIGRRTGSQGDMEVNVCRQNSGWSKAGVAPQTQIHDLESALEYIQDDEFVEVTPTYVRMRKRPRSEKERKASMRH